MNAHEEKAIALCGVFPGLDLDIVHSILAQYGGNVEVATNKLLEMNLREHEGRSAQRYHPKREKEEHTQCRRGQPMLCELESLIRTSRKVRKSLKSDNSTSGMYPSDVIHMKERCLSSSKKTSVWYVKVEFISE